MFIIARRFRGDCGRSYVDIVYWERTSSHYGGWNEISLSTVEDLPYPMLENGRARASASTHSLFFILFFYIHSLQVLCTIGKLKEIPKDFPLETEEITISNQDIRTIQPSSKQFLSSTEFH